MRQVQVQKQKQIKIQKHEAPPDKRPEVAKRYAYLFKEGS